MAGTSNYHDSDEDGGGITDINVTPFVDILLVLLVVFMVTAKLIVARGVDVDKPRAASGGEQKGGVQISIKADGKLFINGTEYTSDLEAVARIKQIVATTPNAKAIIEGDRLGPYENVMRAIDLAHRGGVTGIALANQRL
jgi:biopolymer transport protein ExbD